MKTTPVTKEDLLRSVIAVPPLARHADFSLNKEANRALIRYLESGGVRSLMYGGNANFYHIPLSEYSATLDFLADAAGADTWVLPSIGPDYGKAIDQATIIKASKFPTAMLLPMSFPFNDAGLAIGIRRITDAMGKPAVVYIKNEPYLKPETLKALVDEGRVASVKYAVVRDDPAKDDYLTALCQAVDKKYLVSGIGERPAIVHLRDFGITSFTSGSVCLAPAGSMKLLELLKAGKYDEAEKVRATYIPFEDCRDGISPIRVLHDGVTLAGIADMGPMLPMITGLTDAEKAQVLPVAKALAAANTGFMQQKAAA
ncbi:MAG: dihydrodipicolinate synthase family protein [Betaproteobacteria bacterium]|nr:dihydrodipicolinate synthase family protein [Betaproteobacteria bacterium]